MSDAKLSRYYPTFSRWWWIVWPLIGRAAWRVGLTVRALPRRAWKPLLGLLLVAGIAHGSATLILGRRVEAELAALHSHGEPLTFADLALPPVPDSENAAVVLRRLAAELDRLWRPFLGPGTDFLWYAGTEKAASAAEWETIERFVAQHGAVLLAAEAAAARPRFRFTDASSEDFEYRGDVLSAFHRIQTVLRLQAMTASRSGNARGALHSISTGIRLAQLVREEDGYGEQAGLEGAARALSYVAQHVRINAASARRLERLLASVHLAPGHLRDIRHDRVSHLSLFPGYNRYGPRALDEICGFPRKRRRLPFTAIEGYLWRPVAYYDELAFLRDNRRMVASARQVELGVTPRFPPGYPTPYPWWAQLSGRHSSPLSCPPGADPLTAQATVAGARAFLMLLAYRDKIGTHPRGLQELRRDLGWEPPPDPFSGRDFHYRPEGKGFILYSVGRNLNDDGGEDELNASDDIVWRMP